MLRMTNIKVVLKILAVLIQMVLVPMAFSVIEEMSMFLVALGATLIVVDIAAVVKLAMEFAKKKQAWQLWNSVTLTITTLGI